MRAGRFALWPAGFVGRVFLVLLAALALEFGGSVLLYQQTAALLPTSETLDDLAGRLVRTRRALAAVPPADRSAITQAVSGDGLHLSWTAGGPGDGQVGPPPMTMPMTMPVTMPVTLLQSALLRLRPELAETELTIQSGSQGGGLFREVTGTVRLPDGSLLLFAADGLVEDGRPALQQLVSIALFAGGVLLASAMVVHTLSAPLRRLARVAGVIGRGPTIHVAEKRGPREVREVARALNAMQARIAGLLNDRTEALAAVSHDLRTPIARLRLRLGLLPEAEAAPMEGDLAEMEGMISAVLAYLGGEADPERRRPLDLASIVQTLVDEACDAGSETAYRGPNQCRIEGRPLELKRAIGNLLNNARLHGGGDVTVSLDAADPLDGRPAVRLRVEDRGPGIPETEMERVLGPFQRVDTSRNAGMGGIGLGLAIVRRAAERDGGRLRLSNREGGGLCAEMVLPVKGELPS